MGFLTDQNSEDREHQGVDEILARLDRLARRLELLISRLEIGEPETPQIVPTQPKDVPSTDGQMFRVSQELLDFRCSDRVSSALIDELRKIEALCFRPSIQWSRKDFLYYMRASKQAHFVSVFHGENRVGYLCYELVSAGALGGIALNILSIAVKPSMQRRGAGSQLINYLFDVAKGNEYRQIMAITRECNVDAQLFFRSQGFLWTETVKADDAERLAEVGNYDVGIDWYVMRADVQADPLRCPPDVR